MKDPKETISKEKKTFMIISLLFVFALILGISFAYFMAQDQSAEQVITTAKLSLNFSEGNIIRATNISPLKDSQIKTEATELPFSVTNTGDQHMKLTIKLTDITIPDALKNVDFRWGLYNADTNNGVSFGIFKNTTTEEILLQDVILDQGSAAKNYILRVWIHDTGILQETMMGQTFKAKVTVSGDIIEYTPESCFTLEGSIIIGYSDTCPKDVVIPKTINETTITEIDGFNNKSLTSVILPDTITKIYSTSFSNNSLKHITIPDSVTSIGDSGFFDNKLTSISIPETVESIGAFAFDSNELTTLILPGNISLEGGEPSAFSNNLISNLVLMEGIDSIQLDNFSGNQFTSVEIPSTVSELTVLDSDKFANNSYFKKIIVRGKNGIDEFTNSSGLTELTNVNIEFVQ